MTQGELGEEESPEAAKAPASAATAAPRPPPRVESAADRGRRGAKEAVAGVEADEDWEQAFLDRILEQATPPQQVNHMTFSGSPSPS